MSPSALPSRLVAKGNVKADVKIDIKTTQDERTCHDSSPQSL
jgi:hypothetical protein